MTQHLPGDEAATADLIFAIDNDVTWLRHRGRAAELDRRLLQGATEEELAEVRPDWKRHVDHLRNEHGVLFGEHPQGIWRISGARDEFEPEAMPKGPSSTANVDDEEDSEGQPDAPPDPVQGPRRLAVTARALAALAAKGLMADPLLKASVSMLIRQASESNHWHNCAHYRSRAAKQILDSEQIASAFHYQRVCRSTLRHEHVVPNNVIYKMLCRLHEPTQEAIEDVLHRYCIRATISIEEDQELSRQGLTSSMPEGFWTPGHPLHSDPMARYKVVGLYDQLQRRQGDLWFVADRP